MTNMKRGVETVMKDNMIKSIMAGVYIGLAVFLVSTMAGISQSNGIAFYGLYISIPFALALALILIVGGNLFTGNVLHATMNVANKRNTMLHATVGLVVVYILNIVGSVIVAVVFNSTGSSIGTEWLIHVANVKVSMTPLELISRGIMCNMLVCLSVVCYNRMKSDSAKLLMLILCLYAFVTSGYEHSVANMSIFAMAYLNNGIDLTQVGYNLLFVTIGNIIGGVVVGLVVHNTDK